VKVLVVYAHPNPKSFNHAILEELQRGLIDGGHACDVIDLYATQFDPRLSGEDFAAYSSGGVLDDVKEHQEKISAADALIFIYPIWWWHAPALFKGWIDRVMTLNFAFTFDDRGSEGLLKHKKIVFINTTMGPQKQYEDTGIANAITKIDEATWRLVCGVKDVQHFFLYSVGDNDEVRRGYLEKVYNLGKEFTS